MVDIVPVAEFALQRSKSLCQALEHLESPKQAIRELRYELESLNQALEACCRVLVDNEVQLIELTLPLFRCGTACMRFEFEINRLVPKSESQRRSFRDWARLQYLQGDFVDFRHTLAGYKVTINTAIAYANLRQTAGTAHTLKEYKQYISEANSYLEDQLQRIEDKLQALNQERQSSREPESNTLTETKEEKQSIKQCLNRCAQVSEIVQTFEIPQRQKPDRGELPPSLTPVEKEIQDIFTRLSALRQRLIELHAPLKVSGENHELGKERIGSDLGREEHDRILQCLRVCKDASQLADNSCPRISEGYTSADPSHSMVVTTLGDLMRARKMSPEANPTELFGQMSNKSLQMFLSDSERAVVPNEEQLKTWKQWAELEHPGTPIGMGDLEDANVGRERLKDTEKLADRSGTHIVKDTTSPRDEDDDPSSTTSMTNPASTYMGSGLLGETEQLSMQRVDGCQRVLGSQASMSDASSMPQSQEVLTQPEESSFAATTLLGIQEQQMLEPKPSSSLDRTTLNTFEHEDCISVVSDDNDIASKTATMRSKLEILAVRHIASFLYELKELRPLHEQALKKLGPKRFQENYRRILKFYVLKLRNEARTAMQNDIIRVLKSRLNRINLARQIIDLIQEDKDDSTKPLDKISSQPVEKQSLEDWIRNTHGIPVIDTVVISKFEGYEQSSDGSGSEDTEDEYRAEELPLPNITHADRFLHTAIPFQTLLLELNLLVLPASLREVVESTPKHLIHISPGNDTSLMNMAKGFIEDHTAFEWDWWPLMPRVPDVSPGRLRLQWRVSNPLDVIMPFSAF
ncbi:hypothetical protein ABOM_004029 [Aspergillus bombycis]|uniref:Azaphilone pigments biosynthesis cluster protein L N-terminal domain-containing protein n=1 Tax=Aspergillus bombycis TaxID=109264 RepID=A0A1F8ABZ8_9EURO|nr:hypothetical protein ABOM_004029 [Aspergillus bombycis]OGM49266.1 hypothetical protein ABOM_004029 [Aspergillus bombycis]